MDRVDYDLEILKEIQEWDKQIYALRDALEEMPDEIAVSTRALEQEKLILKQFEEQLKQLQLQQKSKEVDLATKEENVRKFETQLMQVKTNKEYSALKSEITSLKADNSLLEEMIIGLLDRLEDLQRKVQEQKKILQTKEAEHQVKVKLLEEKAKSMREEIDLFSKQKCEKIKEVKPEIAQLYEQIVLKKHGIAFVKVQGEVCGACQMRLRPQILNEVMQKEKVVICESCSRMLYTD